MGIRRGSISTPIIADGLVFNMDAANRASYPRTGTTWFDTIGTNNGTLINDPLFNIDNKGSIDFDGTDDYVNISSSALNPPAGSLCFWIKTETSRDIYNSHSAGWNQNSLWMDATNLMLRISNGTADPGDVTISSSLITDNIFHFVCTTWVTGGERAIWLDGTKRASLTNTLQFTPGSTLEIGYKSWGASYFSGNIANVHAYNRVLNATEVLHNYNALKGRFGL